MWFNLNSDDFHSGIISGIGSCTFGNPPQKSAIAVAVGFDPLTNAAVAGILLGAALVASLVPAARAARNDPVTGIRQG